MPQGERARYRTARSDRMCVDCATDGERLKLGLWLAGSLVVARWLLLYMRFVEYVCVCVVCGGRCPGATRVRRVNQTGAAQCMHLLFAIAFRNACKIQI